MTNFVTKTNVTCYCSGPSIMLWFNQAEANVLWPMNNSNSHCIAGKLRSDFWQRWSLMRGKRRHLGDCEGREPNTSNVTQTATINLPFAISPATTHKPVALNHHQLTEANADDRYDHTLLANCNVYSRGESRGKDGKVEQQVWSSIKQSNFFWH